MYIIKNALRCIGRAKGRNVLIGIIALVIAIAACIGLSIRQAAESTKNSALAGMQITATISFDRSGAMGSMGGRPGDMGGGFDKNQFAGMMGGSSSLTLEEYLKYAEAESVQDFYYTLTAYFNGSDSFLPVSDETDDTEGDGTLDGSLEEEPSGRPQMPGGMGGMGGMMGGFSAGDFTIIGYSSDSAMTEFVSGTASILDGGVMFDEGTEEMVCVISEELAIYNSLSVGDIVTLTNPSLESESYELTIVGIYTSSQNNDFSMSIFGTSQDPANKIYMSAGTLQTILDVSEENNTTITDESTGRESDSKLTGTLAATYTFADVDAYYAFETEVRELGLSDTYAVSSSDISSFENSLAPLNTLGTMAGWFLVVILIIGGVILVVLNIFNVRERKYEVGVLTAMGMKNGRWLPSLCARSWW